jgi:hypothetical protein
MNLSEQKQYSLRDSHPDIVVSQKNLTLYTLIFINFVIL